MAYRVVGGKPLEGSVRVSGSKNAALPLLFAALMIDEPVTLIGVPDIGDVRKTVSLFQKMGATVKREGSTLTVCAANPSLPPPDAEEILSLRASSYLLGAGLSRFGKMRMCYPGGCNLGARPLDIHRFALCTLGASWDEGVCDISVSAQALVGKSITLSYASVGATVNALLAAVCAKGETVLYGCAKEPHITSLIRFLRRAGADITASANAVTVRGGKKLHGCRFTVMADDIEASTFLIGGALTGGHVTVEGASSAALFPLLSLFDRMGIKHIEGERSVTVLPSSAHGVSIVCAPYPAFPTDLQPQAAVLLSSLPEGGRITERVWRERFAYVRELQKMGFLAERKEASLYISPSRLHGAHLYATDLRAGAAMMLAALCADGESIIENTFYIDRGYENFLLKWKTLGACAERFEK